MRLSGNERRFKMDEQYVMFKEFCDICGICPATARKAIANKSVRFQKCQSGRLHYYQIPLQDVLQYKEKREKRGYLSEEKIKQMRMYYDKKLKDYSDLITAYDIRCITGYGKEIIRQWINREKILGVVVRGKFCVAKEDLIDFLVSPYYERIIRKTPAHIADRKAMNI